MDVDGESLRNSLSSVESSVVLEDFRPNEELKRGESSLGVKPLKSKVWNQKQRFVMVQGDSQQVSDLWTEVPA